MHVASPKSSLSLAVAEQFIQNSELVWLAPELALAAVCEREERSGISLQR